MGASQLKADDHENSKHPLKSGAFIHCVVLLRRTTRGERKFVTSWLGFEKQSGVLPLLLCHLRACDSTGQASSLFSINSFRCGDRGRRSGLDD